MAISTAQKEPVASKKLREIRSTQMNTARKMRPKTARQHLASWVPLAPLEVWPLSVRRLEPNPENTRFLLSVVRLVSVHNLMALCRKRSVCRADRRRVAARQPL